MFIQNHFNTILSPSPAHTHTLLLLYVHNKWNWAVLSSVWDGRYAGWEKNIHGILSKCLGSIGLTSASIVINYCDFRFGWGMDVWCVCVIRIKAALTEFFPSCDLLTELSLDTVELRKCQSKESFKVLKKWWKKFYGKKILYLGWIDIYKIL